VPHCAPAVEHDVNSEADPGESIADPVLILALPEGKDLFPDTVAAMKATRDWTRPLIEAVLSECG
jgi:hypothetical protein